MRTTAHTLGMAVLVVTAASGAGAMSYADPGHDGDARHEAPTLDVSSRLRDLQPTTAQPFDGAHSRVRMDVEEHSTAFQLRLTDIGDAAAGLRYGAHLHVGRCVAGDGAAAGPHYNVDVLAGVTPAAVDETTEVWLDFRVRRDGTARAEAWVPFAVQAGDRSIVIHAEPTAPGGTAGARLACLPVVW